MIQNPLVQLQDGLALYESGLFDEALGLVRPALRDHPHDGQLWELCGLIQRARNDCVPCLHALETASILVPLSAAGQCALADCYVHTGRHDMARDLYRHLMALPDVPTQLWKSIAGGLECIGDLSPGA